MSLVRVFFMLVLAALWFAAAPARANEMNEHCGGAAVQEVQAPQQAAPAHEAPASNHCDKFKTSCCQPAGMAVNLVLPAVPPQVQSPAPAPYRTLVSLTLAGIWRPPQAL